MRHGVVVGKPGPNSVLGMFDTSTSEVESGVFVSRPSCTETQKSQPAVKRGSVVSVTKPPRTAVPSGRTCRPLRARPQADLSPYGQVHERVECLLGLLQTAKTTDDPIGAQTPSSEVRHPRRTRRGRTRRTCEEWTQAEHRVIVPDPPAATLRWATTESG